MVLSTSPYETIISYGPLGRGSDSNWQASLLIYLEYEMGLCNSTHYTPQVLHPWLQDSAHIP